MNSIAATAEDLARRGQVKDAMNLLERAQQAGDAQAARQLALWYLSGRWFRRDLAASRAWFGHAGALGDAQAAAIHRAFVANGTGGPADWHGAMDFLSQAASDHKAAAEQLGLIAAMLIDGDGDPRSMPYSAALSPDVEVRHFPGFLTVAECAYLIAAAAPLLEANVVIDPRSGQMVPHPIRTSHGASFPLVDENPAIHALNRRIAAATASDVRAGEPLQVLRYEPGQEYRPHLDALPGVAAAQQRVLTFLIALNDDYDGGETDFPKLGVRFKGKSGDGLMFRNALPDGRADQRLIHAGMPVKRGVKYLASRWIRATPIDLG